MNYKGKGKDDVGSHSQERRLRWFDYIQRMKNCRTAKQGLLPRISGKKEKSRFSTHIRGFIALCCLINLI